MAGSQIEPNNLWRQPCHRMFTENLSTHFKIQGPKFQNSFKALAVENFPLASAQTIILSSFLPDNQMRKSPNRSAYAYSHKSQ
jgi:hypothetical protein